MFWKHNNVYDNVRTWETDTDISSKQRHNFMLGKFDNFVILNKSGCFSVTHKYLKCLTCCDGGHRTRTHSTPLLRVWRADSPCGGGHVSLHVTQATGSRVLHCCMDHLSPDPRDHSLLFLLSCLLNDWLQSPCSDITTCVSQHKPVAYLHTSLDATQTQMSVHKCSHPHLRLIR